MSYQVLARKWRPRTFAEMAGQEHVLRALSNGLANDRLHHAYLFTGTRGVGKTSVARILAKCLNCERQGVTPEPCGECAACTEIDQGRFVDLIEVDAASRTRVEDTRELLDNVQYAPTRGRYKIYLIDEVHMLSGHSFNALLKTLEEPPPHVKFLLATTDPQKLPVTVLSRCLQFNLKHLPAALIGSHLSAILEREGIAHEAAAVARLARAADGSMRDALSLLDQAIAHGGGRLGDAEVQDMLGTIDRDFVLCALEALAAADGEALLAVSARMAERAPDFADALDEMLAVLHQLALVQVVPSALGADVPERERLTGLAQRLAPETVQLAYQIVLNGRRDLPLAPEPRAGFEMVLLRLLAFRPATVADAAPASAEPSPSMPAPAAVKPSSTPAAPERSAVPAPEPAEPAAARPGASPPPAKAPAPRPAASPEPGHAAPTESRGEGGDWQGMIDAMGLAGMTRALAAHCDWGGRQGDVVRLRIDQGHQHLVNPGVKERLEASLGEYFGAAVKLTIDVGEVAAETPAQAEARTSEERQRAAEAAIESDPNITALRETFGAQVVPNSIKPIND
jgi:DNA polymerase-3 subunit gamma/tau